jgi:hypothetical protein
VIVVVAVLVKRTVSRRSADLEARQPDLD